MNLDLSNVKETEFQLIPDGSYKFLVSGAELKTTKDGSGEYIKMEFVCLDEKYSQRKVWSNFNIKNKNAQAENIGKSHLKALLKAGGKDNSKLMDTNDLLGLTVVLKIGNEHRPPYSPNNTVKGFVSPDASSSKF